MSNAVLFESFRLVSELHHKLSQELIQTVDWRHLAEHDFKIQAIHAYRKLHDCSLRDAYEAVNSYLMSDVNQEDPFGFGASAPKIRN